jgi:hypothetical protein
VTPAAWPAPEGRHGNWRVVPDQPPAATASAYSHCRSATVRHCDSRTAGARTSCGIEAWRAGDSRGDSMKPLGPSVAEWRNWDMLPLRR